MTWQEILAPLNTLILLGVALKAGGVLARLASLERDVRALRTWAELRQPPTQRGTE